MFQGNILKKFEAGTLTVMGISMTLVMFVNVVLRYAMDSSLVWAEEFVRIVFVWAMFIAITTGFLRREHIGFDTLMRSTRFTCRVHDILYGVALIVIGGLMFWFGHIYNGYTGDVMLPGTELPTAVFLWPGVIAGALWALIGLYYAGKSLFLLVTGKE